MRKEKEDFTRLAHQNMAEEFLGVLDHFEMGLKNALDQQADEVITSGFQMVLDQFMHVLKKFQVEPVDALGALFDPTVHEAVTQTPSAEFEENIVMMVARKGYVIGDKLLRPAQVVVSSGAPSSEEEVV